MYPDYCTLLCKVTHTLLSRSPQCPPRLTGTLRCLTLALGSNCWVPLAVIAVVSAMHLWPPSSIWHNNAPVPVWTCDTNEIGIWKWGTVLWHWVIGGAVSRSCDQNTAKRICPCLCLLGGGGNKVCIKADENSDCWALKPKGSALASMPWGRLCNLGPWYTIWMFYCGGSDAASSRPAWFPGLVTCAFGTCSSFEQL